MKRALVGLIYLLVETSKAFGGGTVADFLVLPPRLVPSSLGRGVVYADSQTGRVRFLDVLGGSIEAGTADRIQTLLADPLSPSEGRIYGNTTSHLLRYWDGSAWQILATAGGTVPATRQILTTAPLAGGGNLSADRTLSLTLAGTPGLWVTGGGLAFLPKPSGGLAIDGSGAYVAATAVAAGSYPALGQIPTFAVGADGRLTAAGSTTSGAGLTGIPNSALVNSSLSISVSSGLTSAGCSPVSLGGTCTVSLGTELAGVAGLSTNGLLYRNGAGVYGARTLTAGSGISVSNGDGSAGNPTVALTTNSLTVAAGTGLSGGGSVALGSSTTLSLPNTGPGAGSIAYPTNITLDAQGRVTAATAGSAPANTGSIVMLAVVGTGGGSVTWSANQYVGIASTSGSNAATTIGAWSTEVAGTLKNFKYTSHLSNPSGAGRTVTVYKAPRVSGGCGTFVATTAVMTMPLSGQGASDTTNPQTLASGDCILLFSNFLLATGAGGAITVTAQFIPN